MSVFFGCLGVVVLAAALFWGDTFGRLSGRRSWDADLPTTPCAPSAAEQMAIARAAGETGVRLNFGLAPDSVFPSAAEES
jgi:hypothetical protein